jgi:N-terminal acetyltransferase B complex non-catalytic subunit
MEQKLRPIYQAIDNRQYTKAIKLSLLPPQNSWPITIALRCHCLVRCGPARYKEACVEMRSLVKVFGDDWSELDERIWLLSLDSTVGSTSSGGNASVRNNDKSADSQQRVGGSFLVDDAVDVLDIPLYQRLGKCSSNEVRTVDTAGKNLSAALELTDETTLATLAIAMSYLHLHGTVSKLYSCAIQTLQSHISTFKKDNVMKHTLNEQLYNLLVKGYLSNLKVIATLVEFSPCDTLEKIYNERITLSAWEEAQFYAMNLVKVSEGERLYSTWMIVAIMEHCRSCQRLLTLLLMEGSGRSDVEVTTHHDLEREKLQQKLRMLPRLAEMMTMKQIQKIVEDGGNGGGGDDSYGFPPSADDVRVFVECLDMQSKFQEAIDFLDQIGERSKSSVVKSRQIEDESDVKHHVGSVIQLTEKERLEMKVSLLNKMNRHDEVFQIYSDELLVMMPDQWSYWKGLLDCSSNIATGSESCAMCVHVSSDTICRHVLDRVLEEEGKRTVEGKRSKIPLRGPNLFTVELYAHEIRNGSNSTSKDLASSIIAYGNIYAPLVHCCFQDLRSYIELLVKTSCEKGIISDEVKSVLEWALEIQNKSNPLPTSQNVDRKSELRAYIASVKVCFEVWYQLCQQCEGDEEEANYAVDKAMASFVPSVEDMIQYWVHTMDLGSNPKDGGQKESLPGDDLVLLAVQLINHVHRYEAEEKKMEFSIMAGAILEYAMSYSPYNAYLKIAAMKQHLKNGAIVRAYEVFDDIDIKQIQLESCSYFILNDFLKNGLYKEAIEQAGKIINLHSTSEKDLCSFMPRAFENGNIRKGLEMIKWQRQQMSTSLQLLEAKGIIMDLAPFLGFENQQNIHNSRLLGSTCGLVGGPEEGERAGKIVRDSTNFYAAPSILNLARDKNNIDHQWSDNRDFTVYDYEILEKSTFEFHPFESLSRAHEHCILTKMVMVSQIIKPPKKGKVVKITEGEILDKRSRSLLQSIEAAESFFSSEKCKCNQSHKLLFSAAATMSRAFSLIVTGRHDLSSLPSSSTDKLEEREQRVIPMLQSAQSLIQSASSYLTTHSTKAEMPSLTIRLLPDVVIMVLASLNICANACSVFGWGKRKLSTKPVATCMADLALCFKTFLTDMSTSLEYYKGKDITTTKDGTREIFDSSRLFDLLPNSHGLLQKIIRDCDHPNDEVRTRIKFLLMQMVEELNTFDVTSND